MKLSQFTRRLAFVTLLSLIYIHMQMQIFDLAYQGKNKEKILRQLNEDNGNATYSILKLKSANNIGDRLLSENSDMRFLDNTNIVRLGNTEEGVLKEDVVLLSQPVEKINPIVRFFSLRSEAQAHPQQ